MRKDILKFYEDKGFQISKLIDRRPENLTSDQVEAGAIKLFNMIQKGEIIKDINIARRVFKVGESIRYEAFKKEQRMTSDYKDMSQLKDDRFWACIIAFCSVCALLATLMKFLGGF